MYMGQMANLSANRVFKAASSIETGAFSAVTLGENGVVTSAAGEVPIGILASETSGKIIAGEEVNVQTSGGGLWQVGEAVKQGDLLSAGDDGKAIIAQNGKYIFAIALESASANEAVAVQIIHAGLKG